MLILVDFYFFLGLYSLCLYKPRFNFSCSFHYSFHNIIYNLSGKLVLVAVLFIKFFFVIFINSNFAGTAVKKTFGNRNKKSYQTYTFVHETNAISIVNYI